MPGAPTNLPPRFPCWCQAVYSWGGETKRDLGFIEGDLIECLNAGDGSWWMGRLRRDRRIVGLFPSNFVKVLDESFQPAPMTSRHASPLAPTNGNTSGPEKARSLFRKPFTAYEKAGSPKPVVNAKEVETRNGTLPEREKSKKLTPFSSMKTAQTPGTMHKNASTSPLKKDGFRVPSPPPRGGSQRQIAMASSPAETLRGVSPAPSIIHRAASPAPTYRVPSPAVPDMYRAASPAPTYRAASPAPLSLYRAASPAPSQYRPVSPAPHDTYRVPSPAPQTQYPAYSTVPSHEHQSYVRGPSPSPYGHYDQYSRAPSPAPYPTDIGSSPPPPAPPPHRTVYTQSRAPSPSPFFSSADNEPNGYHTPGRRSPIPPSPGGGSHMTPSPLRDAMNDVMSSLQDMSIVNQGPPAVKPGTPPNVWSPEAFDLIHSRSAPLVLRPQSALGLVSQRQITSRHGESDQDSGPSLPSSRDGPPQSEGFAQRMEHRLRHTQSSSLGRTDELFLPATVVDQPPAPPPKGSQYQSRPVTASSQGSSEHNSRFGQQRPKTLSNRKSAYELGREALSRTFTTKTSATSSSSGAQSTTTNGTTSTQTTQHSLMSGYSAGGFSATSAGSLSRRKWGLGGSIKHMRSRSTINAPLTGTTIVSSSRGGVAESRPQSPISGFSYHSSHASQPLATPVADWSTNPMEAAGILGGFSAPKPKKSGFFKKMIDSAKTGAANARSTISSASNSRPGSRSGSPTKISMLPTGVTGITGGIAGPSTSTSARDMGLGGGSDWMQVRRDINRSNSLSRNEKDERAERCEMLEIPVLNPIDELHEQAEGDEGLDGLPITEPTDFGSTPNLALVDKSVRFISNLPSMITAAGLAQGFICRPYRSDVQRLRAIFTWVAERIAWEEDFEGEVDTRRVIQTKRGCSEEIAVLVKDMCAAVGLHAEIVRGYLKAPGEILDFESMAHTNHWWNAVIADGEWRIMDCSLAGPTNPKRASYSSVGSQVADTWWFLARPMEICYTHVPLLPEQQHISPAVPHEVLMALPCACPPFFKNHIEMIDFETSLCHLESLEMAHIRFTVPEEVECVAEVEARAFAQDADGDLFESGDTVRKGALAQPEWVGGRKRYTVKAVLPGDEGQGVLKIYAGTKGLMHSIKDNPHPLAFALPLTHTGQNPPYEFLLRHPTPHAQRHDLYVAQPQCERLAMNNTFVFNVRQHPSSLSRFSPDTWGSNAGSAQCASPNPNSRPASAMSMISNTASVSHSGSNCSTDSNGLPLSAQQQKPAKLAIQAPSGKIIRLTRKNDHGKTGEEAGLASVWETVIKIGERGSWRGLVLADRTARWCVFSEWSCD
ncbi:hypothetical protein LTR66_003849 [Elasticomyces elasticus]|nr:hypothetical protein LTR66_003849 [Elasticomyces elasticus]